jgi:hypothetical protein
MLRKDNFDVAQPSCKPVRAKFVGARPLAMKWLHLNPDFNAIPNTAGVPKGVSHCRTRTLISQCTGSPTDTTA